MSQNRAPGALLFVEVDIIMRTYAVPALAAFAILLAALVLASLGRRTAPIAPMAAPSLRTEDAVSETVAAPHDEAAGSVRHSNVPGPQIARTGKVDLLVSDAQAAVGLLTSVARRSGGDVFALQIEGANDTVPASAVMQLRVPANRFDAAMGAVAGTGKVRSQAESASDLSSDIVDSGARLRNLRRTEDDMRAIMDRSGSVEQILEVENQLSQVREQIETLESSLTAMHRQVAYATIDVSLSAESSVSPVGPTAFAQLGNALRSATHAFTECAVAILSGLVWLLVFAPYLAVIAAIAWLGIRRLRLARPSAPRARA
ncbi:MAG: DUF4349 domain-containing protein [Candidatus Eremiobacteraeota bacterium]|nr:DUF4349 domain-containing protein [Candidatus Eremiobacteraeota bacterium]